jgi:hypothetical protein
MRRYAARLWSSHVVFVLVTIAGLLAVYKGRIAIGLYYDDYHFVRPWSSLDLRRVWFGSWDPTGIEAVFFRPLTADLFAARFFLFGMNATAMHALSLVGHGACALLVGWFLRREHLPRSVTAVGVWTYAVYPIFPYSQVSWLTNQMHLAESLLVLIALIWWQRVRTGPLRTWIPLACVAVAAFLLKEDAAMLPSVLLALTVVHSLATGQLSLRRLATIGVYTVALTVALAALRYNRLQALGGYGVPSVGAAYTNLWKGVDGALFLWPTRRPWQAVSSCLAILSIISALVAAPHRTKHWPLLAAAFITAGLLGMNLTALTLPRAYPLITMQGLASGVAVSVLLVGVGAALWRRDRLSLYVLAAGVIIVLGFNAPFALVSKREQFHLLGLGAVLALSGATSALLSGLKPAWKMPLVSVLFLTSLTYASLARQATGDFLPCNPPVLTVDQDARSWWVVPDEVRAWLNTKAAACGGHQEPPPLLDTPIIVWGAYDVRDERNGSVTRWVSDHSVMLLRRGTKSVTLGFRRADATPSETVSVVVKSSTTSASLTLRSTEWQFATIRLRPTALSWTRHSERVDISVDGWFVPALRDEKSQDLRRLGAEIKIVDFPSVAQFQ